MKTSVLLVEDEKTLNESISSYLVNSGLSCDFAFTYKGALEKISANNYDCNLTVSNLLL